MWNMWNILKRPLSPNSSRNRFHSSLGVIETLQQRPLVLLPPGVLSNATPAVPPLAPPPAPPPAPSTLSSSNFMWLPEELQRTTENLIVRTELAREATRRAQIGLAQRMAREVLKLPFDFMAIHGTPEMNLRVGGSMFNVHCRSDVIISCNHQT